MRKHNKLAERNHAAVVPVQRTAGRRVSDTGERSLHRVLEYLVDELRLELLGKVMVERLAVEALRHSAAMAHLQAPKLRLQLTEFLVRRFDCMVRDKNAQSSECVDEVRGGR